MAKITFTQLESLATESVNLSSIVPIVQDGENYKIALSSIDNSDPNWDSTYTSVQTNSASWGIDTVYDDSLLQSTSATWDNTSSAVQTNSAQWAVDTDTIYDDTPVTALQSASANWESTYTTVESESGVWSSSSAGTTLSSTATSPFLMVKNSGGNVRGNNAVDLQLQRTDNTKIAKGIRSSLLGGNNNIAEGNNSVVVGGTDNSAEGNYSAIIGGNGNLAQGTSAEVLGGTTSKALGSGSSTIGGLSLSAIGNYSAVVGGQSGKVDSGHNRSVILGGNGIESDAQDTAFVNNMDVKSSIYIKQITAAGADKVGKCQLWVNATGDLYLTLPNGTDKQIAFV